MSHGILSGRQEGFGSLCIRSISSLAEWVSDMRSDICFVKNYFSAAGLTDSGMPLILMFLHERSSNQPVQP